MLFYKILILFFTFYVVAAPLLPVCQYYTGVHIPKVSLARGRGFADLFHTQQQHQTLNKCLNVKMYLFCCELCIDRGVCERGNEKEWSSGAGCDWLTVDLPHEWCWMEQERRAGHWAGPQTPEGTVSTLTF